jgi:guanylate kinase
MDLSKAVENYKADSEARKLVALNPPLGIAGPTGSGKGTVAHYLTQSANYSPTVSDTTRAPRRHNDGFEVNGVQYWFISEEQAAEKLANGEYIEAKWVHGTTLYGTSIEAYRRVVETGRTPLLEIDVQGMEDLMEDFPDFEPILLLPPSFEVWQNRLDGRGDMNLEQKIRRFATALIEFAKPFENPRFSPVVNYEVLQTAEVIKSGEYRQPEYRQDALRIAEELRRATREFLDNHATN